MADEAALLAKWAFDTLSADSTITTAVSTRIYHEQATQGATYPYIVFNIIPALDEKTLGRRVWAVLLLDVIIVNQGNSYATYSTATSRIDVLFDQKTDVSVTGGTIKASSREFPILHPENDSGIRYTYQGHQFRVEVQAS